MWRLKLGGIVLGAFLAFWGFNEKKLNENITKDPQSVTMAELEKGDYSGSNHVKITDFAYLHYQLVYQAKVDKGDQEVKGSSKVTYAYIPIVSKEHKFMGELNEFISQIQEGNEDVTEPKLTGYSVLVKTKKYQTYADLPSDFEVSKDPAQGIFINKVTNLDKEEKDLLLEGCPGIDLDKVLILEEGRTPTSATNAYAALIGGVLISLLSILWFFKKSGH